ncbi:helix-turn-helix domain-containing protein [uncultured Aeromicrobium sp.]|uniref:helix-turn-helix domain-containing protein n=1 Tax=uncultured Aeromicrobium sp. TaxID=337820 RepID=UPI0025ED6F32|nr:helix-turn-helix domain-containing protein [uncultured Aeromicrobium sp.]
MSNPPDLINVAEAAAILNLSPRAVQHRIANGSLPAQKLPGRTGAYVLKREDVVKARDEMVSPS